jgi:antirestriction protein ArdC
MGVVPAGLGEGPDQMADIYQTITDRIVAQIEQGVGAWRMPWHSRQHGASELALPRNITGRAYRGVNVPMLWATAAAFGYGSPIWATYRQWQERGAQVRKREKAALVVFWKSAEVQIGESEDRGDAIERHLIARGYFVFIAAQVDCFDAAKVGKSEKSADDLSEDQRIAAAEAFFASTGATVRHGGNRAFYTLAGDFIQMPQFGQFVDAGAYYAVLAHEHVHWTGAKPRLDRQFGARFGDAAYAFEELVAELGAAFVCAMLGLENEPRNDHAAYVASWLRTLKNDKKAIFTAASKAQAAADYLRAFQVSQTRMAA